MYKGIDENETYPYILRGERALAEDAKAREEAGETVPATERPTVWWIRPQTVAIGNRHITRQGRAFTKKNEHAVVDAMTRTDHSEFLAVVRRVDNYCFKDETSPREAITGAEERSRIFRELDPESEKELVGASRNPFELRESEKNASGSSSGADLSESTPAGSSSTARAVEQTIEIEPSNA